MPRPAPSAARLVADLLYAVERDDPLATLMAVDAVAGRLGRPAASTLARLLGAGYCQQNTREASSRSTSRLTISARCA